jgi:WD40 repeat protein
MFDPYHKWLGIPPEHRPPTYYQLLGISPQEQDREVIEEAAIRQTAHVRTYQLGPHAAECTRLLNEIGLARSTLLNPAKRKDYDAGLAAKAAPKPSATPAPPTRTAAAPVTAVSPRARDSAAPVRAVPRAAPVPAARQITPRVPAAPAPVAAANDFAAVADLSMRSRRRRQAAPKWPLFAAIGAVGLLAVVAAGAFVAFGGLGDKSRGPKVAEGDGDRPAATARTIDMRPVKPPPPTGPAPGPDPGPGPGPGPDPQPAPEAPKSPRLEEVGRLEGHTGYVTSVALSPDGRYLLSSSDRELWLWDVPGRKILHRLEGHEASINAVVFSPDGRYALTGSGGPRPDNPGQWDDCSVRLWDVDKRKLVWRAEGHQTPVNTVAFSPDGRRCLSGSGILGSHPDGREKPIDCTVRLWDVANGKQLQSFEGATRPVMDVAFGPRGRILACGCINLMAWEARTGKVLSKVPLLRLVFRPALSPDGRRLVGWCSDEKMRTWTLDPFTEVGEALPVSNFVFALALSPDGRLALAGKGNTQFRDGRPFGTDCTARILDLDGHREIAHLSGHADILRCVALSRTGLAATGSEDHSIRLWDLRKYIPPSAPENPPEVVERPPEPERPKTPVPEMAKQAEVEKFIKDLYKAEYAKRRPADRLALAALLLDKAREEQDPVGRFVLLREARDLAVQAADAVTALTAIDELAKEYAVSAFEMKVTALATVGHNAATQSANKALAESYFVLINEALATDDFDTALRLAALADAAAHKTLALREEAREKLVREAQQEYAAVGAVADKLKQNPDDPEANLITGKYLCLRKGDWDKGLPLLAKGSDPALQAAARKDLDKPEEAAAQVEAGDAWWDLAEAHKDWTRRPLLARAGYWYREALPGLTGLNLAKAEGRLKTIAEQAPTALLTEAAGELRRYTGHSDRVVGVSVSRDGRRALSGSADGTVRLWAVATGKELRRLPDVNGEVQCVALSADGHYAAAGTANGLWVCDTKEGKVLTLRRRSITASVALSADGREIATTTGRNGISTHQIDGDNLRAPWGVGNGGWGKIAGIALSADGSLVFWPIEEGTVMIWNPLTHQQLGPIRKTGEVLGLACSPDGKYLATAGADQLIRIWDVATGQVVRSCKGHRGRVTSVAFSGDGRRLISGGDDKTVRLWDVRSGRELRSFAGHTGKVTSVALSADGRRALSGSDDKTVRVWATP